MPYVLSGVLRNPIFEREFIALCRTKRWFFFRALLITLLAAVTGVIAFSADSRTLQDMDLVGRWIFGTAAVVQVGFVFFLTPGLVADIIVSERRRETLDILMTTPMRPSGIVIGKFLSRLCLIGVIVAASFPLVSVAFLYGGITGEQVLGLFAVTVGTMLLTAGPAALVSTIARRLGTAAVLSQVLPFAYCCLLPACAALLFPREDDIFSVLFVFHPLFASLGIVQSFGQPGLIPGVPAHVVYLGFTTLVAATCITLAILRLRRESQGPRTAGRAATAPRPPRDVLAEIEAAAKSRLAINPGALNAKTILEEVREIRSRTATETAARMRREIRTLESKARRLVVRPSRPVRTPRKSRIRTRGMENPVLWKEVNLINSTGSRPLFWVIAILLLVGEILVLTTVDADHLAEASGHIALACTQAILLFLLAGVNAATSIVSEKQQNTLELIHVTPLGIRKIITGKFAGVLRSVFLLSMIPVFHILIAGMFTELGPAAALAWVAIFGMLVIYFTVTGLWHSIVAPRPGRAILKIMLHFAGLMIGTMIAIGIFAVLTRTFEESTAALTMIHPIVLLSAVPLAIMDRQSAPGVISTGIVISIAVYAMAIWLRIRLMDGLYQRHLLGRRVQ